MGGGVLPVAFYKGKLYFLFSREYINSKDDGGLWSDFGGSKDHNETFFQTALREGHEESDSILGSRENIKNLMKNNLQEITINGYRPYIVLINYDRNLPKKFRNRFLKIKENKPHLLCKHSGLFIKILLELFYATFNLLFLFYFYCYSNFCF